MILNRYLMLELSIFLIWLIGLLGAGLYWLWLHQWLWLWLGFSVGLAVLVWLLASGLQHWRNRRQKNGRRPDDVGKKTEMALQDLHWMADALKARDSDLSGIEFYFDTFYQVVQTVSGRLYPEQKNAHLEIKIPYFLKVVELLAHDLRLNLLDNVPGSHMVSLRQIVTAHRYAGKGMRFYGFFRKLTRGLALDSAVMNNIKNSSKAELRDWFIGFYVRKIGDYAIAIYRGQPTVANGIDIGYQEANAGLKPDYAADDIAEPLRILVLGQTGSGKSSCINALFGQAVAEADVIPSTKGLTAYLLNKPMLARAIVYDSEGYGSDSEQLIEAVGAEVLRCDMIILVMSALNPARDYDGRLIQHLRALHAGRPDKMMPPIVVALTHIDQLRPLREWNPPYNIAKPDNPKAESIRSAMQIVADELQIGLGQIAPICIKPGQEYNLDEGLVPTLLQNFDQAKQLRYLRCIERYQQQDYWRRLWWQSKNAGRFITRELGKLTS